MGDIWNQEQFSYSNNVNQFYQNWKQNQTLLSDEKIGQTREKGQMILEAGLPTSLLELSSVAGTEAGQAAIRNTLQWIGGKVGLSSDQTENLVQFTNGLIDNPNDALSNIKNAVSDKINDAVDNVTDTINDGIDQAAEGITNSINSAQSSLIDVIKPDFGVSSEVSEFPDEIRGLSNFANVNDLPAVKSLYSQTTLNPATKVVSPEAPLGVEGTELKNVLDLEPTEAAVGEEAGEAVGELAATETIGAGLDATGVLAPIGIAVGIGGALASLIGGLFDEFKKEHDSSPMQTLYGGFQAR